MARCKNKESLSPVVRKALCEVAEQKTPYCAPVYRFRRKVRRVVGNLGLRSVPEELHSFDTTTREVAKAVGGRSVESWHRGSQIMARQPRR
jgi:hypothetical protein